MQRKRRPISDENLSGCGHRQRQRIHQFQRQQRSCPQLHFVSGCPWDQLGLAIYHHRQRQRIHQLQRKQRSCPQLHFVGVCPWDPLVIADARDHHHQRQRIHQFQRKRRSCPQLHFVGVRPWDTMVLGRDHPQTISRQLQGTGVSSPLRFLRFALCAQRRESYYLQITFALPFAWRLFKGCADGGCS